MHLLEVQQVNKVINNGIALQQISFTQDTAEKIAIVGSSGSGKTTLLKIIAGLIQADSGQVVFEGKKILGPNDKLMPGYKEIAYLSQHYELLNNYRVEELIWFENKLPVSKANDIFQICRINHLLSRKTNELSGGEKQRIALCILLIRSPKMLILDEPFSNLDPINTHILKNIVNELTDELNITCLLTSHDPNDVLPWADEILVMQNGSILQQGSPQELYYQPLNEYVAGMFGDYNIIESTDVPLFKQIKGLAVDGLKMMVRPEHFHLSKDNKGIAGKVSGITFNGSFNYIVVQINNLKLMCRYYNTDLQIGDEIFISLEQDKEWFL